MPKSWPACNIYGTLGVGYAPRLDYAASYRRQTPIPCSLRGPECAHGPSSSLAMIWACRPRICGRRSLPCGCRICVQGQYIGETPFRSGTRDQVSNGLLCVWTIRKNAPRRSWVFRPQDAPSAWELRPRATRAIALSAIASPRLCEIASSEGQVFPSHRRRNGVLWVPG